VISFVLGMSNATTCKCVGPPPARTMEPRLKCIDGHLLTQRRLRPLQGWIHQVKCQRCHSRIARGAVRYHCNACRVDVCRRCADLQVWGIYEVDEIGRAPVVKMRAIRGDGPGVRVLLGGDGGPLEAMHKTSFPRPDDCRPQASQCEAALFPRDSQIEKSASLGASLFFPATCRDSCNKDRPRHARKCSLAKVAPSSTCSLTGSAQTICAQMHPPTVVRAW